MDLEEIKRKAHESDQVIVLVDRGLSLDEVKTILRYPDMNITTRAFFRCMYETYYRPNELLQCNIEDYDSGTGELTAIHTKSKYNPRSKKRIKSPPKHMIVSKATHELLKRVISRRKKGPIFVNNDGNRISRRAMNKTLHRVATETNIQKVQSVTPTGRIYYLVQLKSLREAGERHTDQAGGDPYVSARGAQHTNVVKDRHYHKSGWEEVQNNTKKYHPAFQDAV